MAYKGYYLKISGKEFNNPSPTEYKLYPKLIQDMDSERTADGTLHRNVLSHTPAKIEVTFPIMSEKQFQDYFRAVDSNSLTVEYYDYRSGSYSTRTMYHNDIVVSGINTKSGRYIDKWTVHFIEY